MRHLLITCLVLFLGLLFLKSGASGLWIENAFAADNKKTIQPQLVYPAHAEHCVEPTEIMRRNHMDFLLHQRDETVLKGVRTQKYSLVE